MAKGVQSAGWKLTWANDFEKTAVQAYQHNIGDHITLGDITQVPIESIPDADVIFGGPPCQDFSVFGEGKGEEGDRGKLVYNYRDIVKTKQPKAFLFENVKGLIQKKHRPTFDKLLVLFEEAGYAVNWKLINAWDYGVAQKRERVFIVGIRKDLGFSFEFPEPREGDYRTQVLRDAIGDLPEPYSNHDPKPLGEGSVNFLTRKHISLKKHRPPGMGEPSSTITQSSHKGVPHALFYPNLESTEGGAPKADELPPRRFTVRECLRIQSVPDSYVFPDSMKLSPQYKVVGNGVATYVAYQLAEALAKQLKENTGR